VRYPALFSVTRKCAPVENRTVPDVSKAPAGAGRLRAALFRDRVQALAEIVHVAGQIVQPR